MKRGSLITVMAACAVALAPLSAPVAAQETEAEVTPILHTEADGQLDAVRAATERFRDVEVALAEGYMRDPMNMCETADNMGLPAELGAMGIHYFRPDVLQITAIEPRVDGMSTHTDFLNPSVLLYEPQADGSMELIGIENVVFRDAWYAAGNAEPPHFHGVPWDYMENDPTTELDEAHGFEPHYDLHIWLFRDNPNGAFAPFNPAVTCEHHVSETPHAH